MNTAQIQGNAPQTQLVWVSGAPEGRDYGPPGMFEIDQSTGKWYRKTTSSLLKTGWLEVSSSESNLIDWATTGNYQIITMAYDPTYLTPTTGTILWPDDTVGVFTALVINTTFGAVDSYSITHPASGQTVTQPTVTRDSNGNVTSAPPLVITP